MIVCALPARDAERELDGWLAGAAELADAVVALDDGSVDGTADRLACSPLVACLLRNPRRPSAAGWDDGRNRQRLLHASVDIGARWLVFIDADERITADDARALRTFLRGGDAIPGCAYGLLHHRAWADGFAPAAQWVFRVFDPRRGDLLPDQRLHFPPVPTRVPTALRVRTTIRLQHFGAADAGAVRRRRAKYREADPEGAWPLDFGGLDTPPPEVMPGWPARPADLPVLWHPAPGR